MCEIDRAKRNKEMKLKDYECHKKKKKKKITSLSNTINLLRLSHLNTLKHNALLFP